jgi:5-bromo-4-chloroindolyl phosphate hydrolysis protein
MEEWRKNILEHHLDTSLITLELVLSVIFIFVGYLTGNIYFRGVGIGLVIAWVTSSIVYLFKKKMVKP